MSKHKTLTLRQQFNWWRINRLADRLHPGEAEPTLLKPHVHVEVNRDGAEVRARQKEIFGAYVTTQITILRSEVDGHPIYISATQSEDELGIETHFRAIPMSVEEESLTASALCRVLRAAVAIPEQASQPSPQE